MKAPQVSPRVVVAAAIALGVVAGAYYYGTEQSTDSSANDRSMSPSPSSQACRSNVRNEGGGLDPWGGCFPGPSNTGVSRGIVLSDYEGPCTITVANTVIDSKRVDCYLEIRAKNVQIRNSLVNGHVSIDDPGLNDPGPDYSFAITDSTVDAGPVDAQHNDGNRALGNSHFTAVRVETVGGIGGVFCELDCTVRDSWIHGQDKDESGRAHMSGIRLGSGRTPQSQKLIHNTIRCDAPAVAPDAGCSADVTGYGDFATIQNNFVEHNLLGDSPEGAFCAYGGSTKGKPFPNGNNNVWQNNIVQRGANRKCATYGPIVDGDWGLRGNQWTNNRWDSGELVPPSDD